MFISRSLIRWTGELDIESLECVCGGKLGGGELAMVRNQYKPLVKCFKFGKIGPT